LRRGGSERRVRSGDPGRGGTSDRARWETKAPPDPAPPRLATTAVAPPRLATTAVAPPRAATRPPAGATTRAAAAAPRAEMIAARPPATDPPVTAAAADARPASPGDGTRAVSVRAANPRIAPLVPFCLARARDPSPGSDNSRSSSFSRELSSPGFQHRIPRPSSRETRAFVVPTVVSLFDRHLEARRDAPGGRVVPNVIRSPPSSPFIKPHYSSVRRSQASSLPTRAARTSFATSRASPTATCSRKARAWSTTKPTTIVRVSSAPSA